MSADKNGKNTEKNKRVLLTVRVDKNVEENIRHICSRMGSNKSRISENFLKLAEIMIVREDITKVGWDNTPLVIYPESIIKKIFNILNGTITNSNRFQIWCELGDTMGQYLNDIYSLKNIPRDDIKGMFEIIRKLGWFDYTVSETPDGKNYYIKIPKSFGTPGLVYSLMYRILTKTRFPPENWEDLIAYRLPHPGTTDKKEKKENQEFENKYNMYIRSILDPDLEEENQTNFYCFRKLIIPKED